VKVTVLTSSRAEYSIYLPLLKAMREDNYFDVSIIAFGTHTSSVYGHTVDAIKKDGFQISHELQTCPETDSPESIADSMGKTMSDICRYMATTSS
jgi:GDP/UDP-N,N'-diacetylbacillosamine 2-epimerase (hydrolysing)